MAVDEKKIQAAYKAQEAFMPSLAWKWKAPAKTRVGALAYGRPGKPEKVVHQQVKTKTACGQVLAEPSVMFIHYKLNWIPVEADVTCQRCLAKGLAGDTKVAKKRSKRVKELKNEGLTAEQAAITAAMEDEEQEESEQEPEFLEAVS